MIKKITLLCGILLCIFSCKTTEKNIQNITPVVENTFEITQGLNAPESVIYDSNKSLLYISNVNGNPGAKDGNGYILSCDLEGNIIEEKMITDMDAPKGMAIDGNKLYVSDIDTLIEIDLGNNEIINRYQSSEGMFFNDVAADGYGGIFVTDTGANRIYKLSNGELELFCDSQKLDAPNGIVFDNDQLIMVSWGLPGDGDIGSLKKISSDGDDVVRYGENRKALDGIEVINNDEYFVTGFMSGSLYYVKNGLFTELVKESEGTADLEYIKESGMILIPQMSQNKLLAYKVKL